MLMHLSVADTVFFVAIQWAMFTAATGGSRALSVVVFAGAAGLFVYFMATGIRAIRAAIRAGGPPSH